MGGLSDISLRHKFYGCFSHHTNYITRCSHLSSFALMGHRFPILKFVTYSFYLSSVLNTIWVLYVLLKTLSSLKIKLDMKASDD